MAAFVKIGSSQDPVDGDIKFLDMKEDDPGFFSGVVMVYHLGEWRRICDDSVWYRFFIFYKLGEHNFKQIVIV